MVVSPSGPTLIAYDGSPAADHAIEAAAALFPAGGTSAVVLYVFEGPGAAALPPPPPGAPLPHTLAVPDDEHTEEHARAVAQRGVAVAAGAGFQATAMTAHGGGSSGVWSAIVRIAEEQDAGLIVVGSRGHSGLRATLLGSVSDGVVHHATRPVLVVPRDAGR